MSEWQRRVGWLSGGAAFAVIMVALLASPPTAGAAVICVPNGDDTYTQTEGDPATAPPGSIILDDGETCPSTVPVPPDEELPEPPDCEPCPASEVDIAGGGGDSSPDPGGEAADTGGGLAPLAEAAGGSAPVPTLSQDDPSFNQPLPTTGWGIGQLAIVLAGLGLLALAFRVAARKLSPR
jgi:LPXTG-motif cell wall-anchored protein